MSISSSLGFLIPHNKLMLPGHLNEAVSSVAVLEKQNFVSAEYIETVNEKRFFLFNKSYQRKAFRRVANSDPEFDALALQQLSKSGFVSAWHLPQTIRQTLIEDCLGNDTNQLWAPTDVSIECNNGSCEIDIGDESVSCNAWKVYFDGYGGFSPLSLDAVISTVSQCSAFRDLNSALVAKIPGDFQLLQPCEGEAGKVVYLQGFQFPIFATQSF